MSRTEIVLGGVGGQGVVLSAILLGTAATLFENRKAVQTQSYSSELRGGSARAEVIISDEPISDPQARRPDIVVAFAEPALHSLRSRLKPGGLLVIDADRVHDVEPGNYEIVPVPASNIAEQEMGALIVANLIVLGALIRKKPVVSAQSMEKAIEAAVSPKNAPLNLQAFRRGMEMSV